MELTRCKDDVAGHIYFQHGNEEQRVFIGVMPVMFGYRVVVHPMDNINVPASLCGGAEQEDIEELYSLMYHWLTTVDTAEEVWEKIKEIRQMEERRPWGNDPEFQRIIRELGKGHTPIKVPDVQIYRALTFSAFTSKSVPEA